MSSEIWKNLIIADSLYLQMLILNLLKPIFIYFNVIKKFKYMTLTALEFNSMIEFRVIK